jgi:hypothetical protein
MARLILAMRNPDVDALNDAGAQSRLEWLRSRDREGRE